MFDTVCGVQISDAAEETRDRPEHEGEEIEVLDAVLDNRAARGHRRIVAPCAGENAASREVLVVVHRDRAHTARAGIPKHVGDYVVDGRDTQPGAGLAHDAGT